MLASSSSRYRQLRKGGAQLISATVKVQIRGTSTLRPGKSRRTCLDGCIYIPAGKSEVLRSVCRSEIAKAEARRCVKIWRRPTGTERVLTAKTARMTADS